MNIVDIAEKMHDAQKLTISQGNKNESISQRLKGAYVTITNGLSSTTYFIGTKDGQELIEFVS